MSTDVAVAGLTLEVTDGVARVGIRNPGKRNAFTWGMYDRLESVAHELSARDDLRAVVFRGTPEDGFAAGTDITGFREFESGADGIRYERRVGAVLAAVTEIPVPTIAAVELTAVGAGLALAATCDIVIAERGARFGAPIARTLGNCLPATVVRRLRSRVGAGRADAMLLTARLIVAEDLEPSGFVEVCEPGGLEEAVAVAVGRISGAAPLTLRALKALGTRIDAGMPVPDDEDLLELCYGSADFQEGVSAFLEQRRPEWSGR